MEYRRPSPRMWIARQAVLGTSSLILLAVLGLGGALLAGGTGAVIGIGVVVAFASAHGSSSAAVTGRGATSSAMRTWWSGAVSSSTG